MKTYDEVGLSDHLSSLPGWSFSNQGIEKSFTFKDFIQAWGFMSQIAILAEKLNHHPEWSNVYNRVSIRLSTHDAGGVTDLDLRLAQQIEEIIA